MPDLSEAYKRGRDDENTLVIAQAEMNLASGAITRDQYSAVIGCTCFDARPVSDATRKELVRVYEQRRGDIPREVDPYPLRRARLERGIGLRRAAHYADIDSSQLSRVERRLPGSTLSIKSLGRLAVALDLDDLTTALQRYGLLDA